jgi:hypothetical protein
VPLYTDRFHTTVQHIPGGSSGSYDSVETYNVTANESGTIFTTSGNLTKCNFYLPAAEAGLEYHFHAFETPKPSPPYDHYNPILTSGLTIHVSAGDKLYRVGYTTNYQSATVTGIYYAMRVRAFDDTGWYFTNNFGSIVFSTDP